MVLLQLLRYYSFIFFGLFLLFFFVVVLLCSSRDNDSVLERAHSRAWLNPDIDGVNKMWLNCIMYLCDTFVNKIILFCFLLFCPVLFCSALLCSALHYSILFYSIVGIAQKTYRHLGSKWFAWFPPDHTGWETYVCKVIKINSCDIVFTLSMCNIEYPLHSNGNANTNRPSNTIADTNT